MTDQIVVPRHLRVLGASWTEISQWLKTAIDPALAPTEDRIEPAHIARFVQLAKSEMDALNAWVERLSDWLNGPLAAALSAPEILDQDMRRIADRMSHFASELIDRRWALSTLAVDPAMRAAAPQLDAVYASLLWQIGAFVAKVAQALRPEALKHSQATRQGHRIELSFDFRPTIEPEMSRFLTWVDRACGERATEADLIRTRDGATDQLPAKPHQRVELLVLLPAILALSGAIAAWGTTAVLVALVVSLVIIAFRYPLLALIGLFLGFN